MRISDWSSDVCSSDLYQCTARACEGPGALWWTADGARIGFIHREGWADAETAIYEWTPGKELPSRLFSTTDLPLDCQPVNNRLIFAAEKSTTPRQLVLLAPATARSALLYDPKPDFSGFSISVEYTSKHK